MCGIFGIISRYGDVRSVHYNNIAQCLIQGLSHRGPDGNCVTILDDYCLLGHTRLAINDIEGGTQPFLHSSLDGVSSVVNGEIYNYHLLRDSLQRSSNHRLDTNSDCEPLAFFLLGSSNHQREVPEGMYAAAFYNRRTKTLSLARDIFGEKPLYIYMNDHCLIFSSEINALARANSLTQSDLSRNSLVQFMLYGYSVGLDTIYSNIRQVKSGSLETISIPQWFLVAEDSFWDSSINPTNWPTGVDANTLCEDYLFTYIKSSTLSDVPLCIGLSGGLDSALIAALNCDQIHQSFTVAYEATGGSDETEDAKRTANYLGIPHESVVIPNEDVARLFKEQVLRKDTPIVDIAGIGYAALFERMNERGYKVALMGHGGDELFMGYPWLYKSFVANLSRNPIQSLVYESLPDFRTYFRLLKTILTPDITDCSRWDAFRPVYSSQRAGYAATFDLVRQYWLEPNSLKMGDALSMSYSIESRHPLLSHKVFKLLAEAGSLSFIPEAKWPLRHILSKILPHELIQRKKRYFSPPYIAYYSLIHDRYAQSWRSNQVLRDLNLLTKATLDRFYMEDFKGDWFDYYLFPKLATLHTWVAR